MTEYYIYIIENNAGLIKIGITTDFKQRMRSLSGSNGGGYHIVKEFVSEPTYLYVLERVMHQIFANNRIDGTEWFENLSFNEVLSTFMELLRSDEYKHCNKTRKLFLEKKEYTNVKISA